MPIPDSKVHGNVIHLDPLDFSIDGQPAKREGARGRRRPPQQRAYTGFEFGNRERLGQIVVGAQVEAVHAIFDRVACGQH